MENKILREDRKKSGLATILICEGISIDLNNLTLIARLPFSPSAVPWWSQIILLAI